VGCDGLLNAEPDNCTTTTTISIDPILFCWDELLLPDTAPNRVFVGYIGWNNRRGNVKLPSGCPDGNESKTCNQFYLEDSNGTRTEMKFEPTFFPAGWSSLFPLAPYRIQWDSPPGEIVKLLWYLNGKRLVVNPSVASHMCPQTLTVKVNFVSAAWVTKRQAIQLSPEHYANVRKSVTKKGKVSLSRILVTQPDPYVKTINVTILPPSSRQQSSGVIVPEITTADAAILLLQPTDIYLNSGLSAALAENGIDTEEDEVDTTMSNLIRGESLTVIPIGAVRALFSATLMSLAAFFCVYSLTH
jgi:hypothetical protein